MHEKNPFNPSHESSSAGVWPMALLRPQAGRIPPFIDWEIILMTNIEIAMVLVLVDHEGTAFLVVASPSSCYHTKRQHSKAKMIMDQSSTICTPVSGSKCELKPDGNYSQADYQSTSKRQRINYSHEEDEAVVETAMLARKGQLEKDAEQRAEIIFKQWCKEKKTLEQAIDETLRFGVTR